MFQLVCSVLTSILRDYYFKPPSSEHVCDLFTSDFCSVLAMMPDLPIIRMVWVLPDFILQLAAVGMSE